MERLRIGELLVNANVLTQAQLDVALARPRAPGVRLGDLLVDLGMVSETALAQALSQQLAVPWVSLYHVEFSRQLLDLIPRELADAHCLVPVFVRTARGGARTLYVAMDDPTNEQALAAAKRFSGLDARPMIASRSDIQNAIRVYYSTGVGSQPPRPGPDSTPPTARVAPPPPRVPSSVRKPPVPPPSSRGAALIARAEEPEPAADTMSLIPASADGPDASPEIEAHELPLPRARPTVTLTLLDGSTVALPSRAKPVDAARPAHPEALTARDLVSALRAVTHGADASEILGEDPRWEAMFAALLSLMLRKGLIADWEFVEELGKI